ncbi:MAG TPA: hypothetical protein VKJ45_13885 [Blastocatellia bacterium]|nr:hypothetical protein [Blastocatellia bacterium]
MKKQLLERIDDTLFRSFSPGSEPWVVGGDGTVQASVTFYNGCPADCDQMPDVCSPDQG